MNTLFNDKEDELPTSARAVGIAVNANVWDSYTYLWPDSLGEPVFGQRVRVPFGRGNRKVTGFVVEPNQSAPASKTLKSVAELVDHESLLTDDLKDLARWINKYYLTPLGMTLSAMLPSAIGSHAKKQQTFIILQSTPQDWPAQLGKKQRTVLDELWEAKKQGVDSLSLEELMHHSHAGRETIHRLLERNLINTQVLQVTLEHLQDAPSDEHDITPNADQQAVLEKFLPRLNEGFSVTLLRGVTGSGKTEVYVRTIRRVIEAGKQAILLAPEIALTTQTLQRLLKRLPRVAVLHSGLSSAQRAFYWQQIRDGHAGVVVGPRSAVFAPIRPEKLGLVVVDEEHESTYKQDTAPRYHGRDVAIMRASIAGAPVLLGSATPSMESYNNALNGRYNLLELPRRVKNLPMPRLEIVNLRREMKPGRIELIGQTLQERMAGVLDRGEQIILLMNRRGYASYVFCPKCDWMLECSQCVRPMVWHQATQLCVCHHCDSTAVLPERCPACSGKILLFGYGIQRVEDELARKFPTARVARMDSDTMTSPKQFNKILDDFGSGQVDILLGTQMVAKGLDFPKVSLVGVTSADTALALHDFRASERTFQLIVQVAGRAGRSDHPGQVVVQTLHEEEPAIMYASQHDYKGFADFELNDRRGMNLPPFSRMTRFMFRHEHANVANDAALKFAEFFRCKLPRDEVRMVGPQAAEMVKLQNQFRFDILLYTQKPMLIQNILFPEMSHLMHDVKADVFADVDPVNLM